MKKVLAALLAIAPVLAFATACGDGNITQVRDVDAEYYEVGFKDNVDDPKLTWVKLEDKYAAVCGVGDPYPQCKDNLK